MDSPTQLPLKKIMKKMKKMGYLLTASGRIFDVDTGKVLKKGQMSKREWRKFLKFLLKFALIEFFVVLLTFIVINYSFMVK